MPWFADHGRQAVGAEEPRRTSRSCWISRVSRRSPLPSRADVQISQSSRVIIWLRPRVPSSERAVASSRSRTTPHGRKFPGARRRADHQLVGVSIAHHKRHRPAVAGERGAIRRVQWRHLAVADCEHAVASAPRGRRLRRPPAAIRVVMTTASPRRVRERRRHVAWPCRYRCCAPGLRQSCRPRCGDPPDGLRRRKKITSADPKTSELLTISVGLQFLLTAGRQITNGDDGLEPGLCVHNGLSKVSAPPAARDRALRTRPLSAGDGESSQVGQLRAGRARKPRRSPGKLWRSARP